MKPSRRYGLAALVLGGVEGLGAVWWWALRGMSDNVASAHASTSMALLFVGFILLLISAEL